MYIQFDPVLILFKTGDYRVVAKNIDPGARQDMWKSQICTWLCELR